ncbi:MAG: ATP-binding cassette domain-containing protein, partial [Bradyrhizobium sp.]
MIRIDNISKQQGHQILFIEASAALQRGEKVGLVGPNGAGKTTLLKILAGREDADAGQIELHASARMEYLEQQPDWAPGRTLWQEALTALAHLSELAQEAEQTAHALSAATGSRERAQLGKRYDRLQHELELRDAYHLDHKIERVLGGLGFDAASFHQ